RTVQADPTVLRVDDLIVQVIQRAVILRRAERLPAAVEHVLQLAHRVVIARLLFSFLKRAAELFPRARRVDRAGALAADRVEQRVLRARIAHLARPGRSACEARYGWTRGAFAGEEALDQSH